MRRGAAAGVLGLSLLGGCTGPAAAPSPGPPPVPAPTPAPTPAPAETATARLADSAPLATCDGPLPRRTGDNDGIRGEASSGSVVALVPSTPLLSNREIKIVWRVTGSGDATFSAVGPGGVRVDPVWGPIPHSGSNFRYPGQEWGTGFSFPTPGCWTVHVARDDMTGRFELPIG